MENDLLELLNYCKRHYSERIAVREKDKKGNATEHTYEQLYEDVLKTAAAFLKAGFSNEKIVVMGENGYTWLVLFWAATISGNVAVPFDKELPPEDIKLQLKACESHIIFCSARYADHVDFLEKDADVQLNYYGNTGDKTNTYDAFMSGISEDSVVSDTAAQCEELNIASDDLAAILFTSGTSSGGNKAVMLTHGNICASLYGSYINPLTTTKSRELISLLPMHHCYELFANIFVCLYIGNTLNFCSSLRYLISSLVTLKPDYITIVPAFLDFLFKQREKFKGCFPKLVVGGAASNKHLLEQMSKVGFRILSGYGMTEAAPLIAFSNDDVTKDDSVGTIFPHVSVKIDEPDEKGSGEILVKGPNISPGYYHDDEANAVSYTEDGWFRTGDIGFIKDKNRLMLTGRKKNIIILENGKNVHPEKIEKSAHEMLSYVDELAVCEVKTKKGDVIGMVLYSEDPDFEQQYKEQLKADIAKMNRELVTYARIVCYAVSKEPLPRNAVKKFMRNEISAMAQKMELIFIQ